MNNIRITKTSAQAKAEEQVRQEMYERGCVCPECNNRNEKPYLFPMIRMIPIKHKLFKKVETESKPYLSWKCSECGCEWESDC